MSGQPVGDTEVEALVERIRAGFVSVKQAEDGPFISVPDSADAEAALASLAAVVDASAKVLPDDEVCACLNATGERKTRGYERCLRCGAFMEADYLTEERDRLAAVVDRLEAERDEARKLLQRFMDEDDEKWLIDAFEILSAYPPSPGEEETG